MHKLQKNHTIEYALSCNLFLHKNNEKILFIFRLTPPKSNYTSPLSSRTAEKNTADVFPTGIAQLSEFVSSADSFLNCFHYLGKSVNPHRCTFSQNSNVHVCKNALC